MKERESEIEGINSLLSKQQETMSKLEQDLGKSELELSQKEQKINDVLQTEVH